MASVIVLGAGMVGRAIAIDLCKDHQVTAADINPDNLQLLEKHDNIQAMVADLSKSEEIRAAVSDFDLVIGAVPGFMGFEMVKAVIESGKNIVDISFFNEDPFLLDELAQQKGVTAIMDCGVAPGMDNILLGYHNERMEVDRFECLVGGLPVVRTWPYEYKAPFSAIDVIAEYTRPARFVKDGKVVTKPALSDPELIDFEGLGTLESFNTDGLRSLIKTMKVPDMIERTLRYPGHIEYMRVLRETGFFNEESVDLKGQAIRPIDLTARLLFPKWKLQEGEEELTVMRVTVSGKEKGTPKTYVYELLDRYDRETGTSSMARTTGYTCTAAANLLLKGSFDRKGICPPEYLGVDAACFEGMMAYLQERNIAYRKRET